MDEQYLSLLLKHFICLFVLSQFQPSSIRFNNFFSNLTRRTYTIGQIAKLRNNAKNVSERRKFNMFNECQNYHSKRLKQRENRILMKLYMCFFIENKRLKLGFFLVFFYYFYQLIRLIWKLQAIVVFVLFFSLVHFFSSNS